MNDNTRKGRTSSSTSTKSRRPEGTEKSRTSRKAKSRRSATKILTVFFIVLLIAAVGVGALWLYNENAKTVSSVLNSNTFYDGVYIDDISLGGMTMDQARSKIEASQKKYVESTGVTIMKDAQSWQFKISQASYSFDTQSVLNTAWKAGREGTDAQRQTAINQLKKSPLKLKTTVTVNSSALEQKVRDLAAPYTVAAVNAAFKSYDSTKPAGQRMTFTPDTPGSGVDADTLWAAVKKEFEQRTFGTVTMTVVPIEADITLAELQNDMQLIGSYQTTIINHSKERLTNITLAGEAISGKIIMPGETFSMNDTTGERTAAKGYQIAPVDINGISDDGLGGGVCQVSGTLFNAAVRAGLTIVERNHHSIPSAYLEKGRDATVDYGNFDLKLKNDYDKPVLFILYYEVVNGKYYENAEIYGPPLPKGVKYELVTKIVSILPAITDKVRYQKNSALKPGETKEIPAHKGYVVDVFLQTTNADGTQTLKKMYTDTYKADCVVIAYWKGDEAPTPMPSLTPTPFPSGPIFQTPSPLG